MQDRVPTKPNRYAVYDDAHNFLRYEYHERADEPTQEGTPLNKETLLNDSTCEILEIPDTSTVSYAILVSYLKASGKAAVEIHCKLPNGEPAAYAKVSGLSGTSNNIANAQGVLTTIADAGTFTLKIDGFIDLDGTSKSVTIIPGINVFTLQSTKKSITSLRITSSMSDIAFSGAVDTYDLFLVGGGGGGGYCSNGGYYSGGGGGGGGYTSTYLGRTPNPSQRSNAVIGAGGTADGGGVENGGTGGTTSLFGLSASGGSGGQTTSSIGNGGSGGSGGGTGYGGAGGSDGNSGGVGGGGGGDGESPGLGQGRTTRAFSEPGGELFSGGGGGGGGAYGGSGGSGGGGAGGSVGHGSGYSGGTNTGGGGGGGLGGQGGPGGSGIILLRWRYKV